MRLKKFLLYSKNKALASVGWNIAANSVMAFQSVVLLMIITRTVGLEEAGVFMFAYANANLFMIIGNFGMRNFQVSDVKRQFQFSEYFTFRIFSVGIMLLAATGYILYASATHMYMISKTGVLIWLCLLKSVDAIEDVFHGFFQGNDRLDVAAKAMTLRVIIGVIVSGICLVVFRDLLLAVIVSTIVACILLCVFTKWAFELFNYQSVCVDWKNVIRLLRTCFPLFVGAFMSFYIGNAPKYSIDAYLTDELQACYGFISMPVNIIGVLNGFIFTPVIYRISVLWHKGEIRKFVSRIVRQMGIVLLFVIVCLAGGSICGISVLSWLYHTNLGEFRAELLILLLGGGFLGMTGLLNAAITIMRYQRYAVWGYVGIALFAAIFSNMAVKSNGIMGAAVIYTMMMAALCIFFCSLFIYGILARRKMQMSRVGQEDESLKE